MSFYLLGTVNPMLLAKPLILLLLFSFIAEAVVLIISKWDNAGNSFLHSLLINIATLLLGLLLFIVYAKGVEGKEISQLLPLAGIFIITILFEAWLLKMLKPVKGTPYLLKVSVAINLVSAVIFYFFIENFQKISTAL
jgi:hypothetical protein